MFEYARNIFINLNQTPKMSSKIILTTLSGREIKGFDKVASIAKGSHQKAASFIIKEAIKEALLNNDKINLMRFGAENLKKISPATLDSANIYLFGTTDYFE